MNPLGRGAIIALALPLAILFTTTSARADEPLKAVFHINFAETGQQGHGLKNISNLLDAVGDDGAQIEVVCHGAGIGLVESARSEHAPAIAALQARGVTFVACQNTMKSKSIRPEDLLPGLGTVPSGVVEVLKKQRDGYAYFKP